jgi:ATP-dependent Lhr-like helicase
MERDASPTDVSMASEGDALARFHPILRLWFAERVGTPTDVQREAWAAIAQGEHVLVTAPTGSGKTLAAFLWGIHQLLAGQWPTGCTSILYVSPLRALNNDIQRNLLTPLAQLERRFAAAGKMFPQIRVMTRSGDTPAGDRRRMLRHPPEILITTPESLNILLSSASGQAVLADLTTVILDEIHAVLSSKRGTHLMTAVERLVRLSGEFQRIALSATVRPLEAVAEFVGGRAWNGSTQAPAYTARRVRIVRSRLEKRRDVRVSFPPGGVSAEAPESIWPSLVEELREIIQRNRSTLVFVNSRRLCERLTLLLNEEGDEPIAYAHHGSLSRELRETVERRLKEGALRAIVATSTLELGIDIGALDEVVLVQAPYSIASAIQRVGRAGHQVGEVSRGSLFSTDARDCLDAAVLAPAILKGDIEPSATVEAPLDVLAQVLVSIVGTEVWDVDELYAFIGASYPYRNLRRQEFDSVLAMLAGRYEDTRIRELHPRLSLDRMDNTVAAQKGALQAVYLSGGTIPDRGYFQLRHTRTNTRLGELDEEFVWEASPGQTFTLGTQQWRIERITHSEVFVEAMRGTRASAPFWKGEEPSRDFHFSERLGLFLEDADDRLDDPALVEELRRAGVGGTTVEAVVDLLEGQRRATRGSLPHRHHVVVEFVQAAPGGAPGCQAVIHTLWGGRLNRPFAMALDAAWEERFGQRLEVRASDDCIMLLLPHDVGAEELLGLVPSGRLESLLRKRLESSGFFGARFRECAGRALLLSRTSRYERLPLWLMRRQSQKLLSAVMRYPDFPILLETWRTCLRDEFDMDNLRLVLSELESGRIRCSEAHTSSASPFAEASSWRQINEYMYLDDRPQFDKASQLRGDLLRDVVFTPYLRPTVSAETADEFQRKRQRIAPGYSPETPREVVDWVKERLLLPLREWRALVEAVVRDHDADESEIVPSLSDRLAWVHLPGAIGPMVVAVEMWPRVAAALASGSETPRLSALTPDALLAVVEPDVEPSGEEGDEVFASFLGEWLRFYGPVSLVFVGETLGVDVARVRVAVESFLQEQVVVGELVEGAGDGYICDAENFESLLRMARARAAPSFEPLSAERLPLFLAHFQGVTRPAADGEEFVRRLERLLCYGAPAALWESEILPARARAYAPAWLDDALREGDLRWCGVGREQVAFSFESDVDLLTPDADPGPDDGRTPQESVAGDNDLVSPLLANPDARYPFSALVQASRANPSALCRHLWQSVWAGRVSNDTFAAVRKGLAASFRLPPGFAPPPGGRVQRRRGRARPDIRRRQGATALPGNWYGVPAPLPAEDWLEVEERAKDRARLLFDRYGVLFRELLQRELPAFRWGAVFRALRLMELGGEVLAGYFFRDVSGPQFASHEAFRSLRRQLPEDVVWWVNAADPASLCGVDAGPFKALLPRRLPGTHVVFRGAELAVVSERNAQALTFHVAPDDVAPDDPDMSDCLALFRHMLERTCMPRRQLVVQEINGEDAVASAYVGPLRAHFEVVAEHRHITLYRKMT